MKPSLFTANYFLCVVVCAIFEKHFSLVAHIDGSVDSYAFLYLLLTLPFCMHFYQRMRFVLYDVSYAIPMWQHVISYSLQKKKQD